MAEQLTQHDPRRIGPFEVLGRLGSGGMGLVYLARSASGRRVAIKTVRTELAEDQLFRVRFTREVEAARAVSGFYTAAVVDADPRAAVPWLATAYVPAPSLEEIVHECGPVPPQAVRWLAAGVAEALQSIHSAGLVHRDLKPSNVLVVEDGPRVIDFGIASGVSNTRLTMTNVAVGTPAYMSPEQARDSRGVTGASDVFSLASTLVFAATGQPPYHGSNPVETVFMLLRENPDLAGLPDELRPLIESCMRHTPEERPTPADLQAQLAPHLFSLGDDTGSAAAWLPPSAVALIERQRARRARPPAPPAPQPPPGTPPPPQSAPQQPLWGAPPAVAPAAPFVAAQAVGHESPQPVGYEPPQPMGHDPRPSVVRETPAGAGHQAPPPPLPAPAMPAPGPVSEPSPLADGPPWAPPVPSTPPGGAPAAVGTPAPQAAPGPAAETPAAPAEPTPWRPWRFRMSQNLWGSPVVQGDLLYVTSVEVHALDLTTGRRQFKTRDVAHTTTVTGGRVIASDGASLYAVDATDGTDRWRHTGDGWIFSLSAERGTVVAGTRGGGIAVREAANGELLWSLEGAQAEFESHDTGPVIDDGTVFTWSAGYLYALEARTGRELWHHPVGDSGATGGVPIRIAPVQDGVVHVAAGSRVLALEAATGAERWQFDAPAAVLCPPAQQPGYGAAGGGASGGVHVVDRAGTVYSLDAATGEERWRIATETRQSTAPVVVSDGLVHLGSGSAMYTLDAATGTPRWRFGTGGAVVGAPVAVDGRVHFGSEDRCLYTVDAVSGRLSWKLETGGAVTGTPAAAGGMVFACSEDHCVYALDAARGTRIAPQGGAG